MSAISFKPFNKKDIDTVKTLIHESIPITGTILSGTYAVSSDTGRELNIKSYKHGMFQTVYDYPYLSSSANKLFDITAGFSTHENSISGSAKNMIAKKVNIYTQMAQHLAGYTTSSLVRRFDRDGNLTDGVGKIDNAVFICFSRVVQKDEIKKGSFSMVLGTDSSYATPFSTLTTVTDVGARQNFRTNSPAGEYGFLKVGETTVGLLYYQAGIAVLTSSVFGASTQILNSATSSHDDVLQSGTIEQFADGVRHRIQKIDFNNSTEINSTIYFCRAGNREFNYSSNPTYIKDSKIVVKTDEGVSNQAALSPKTYLTTVGLYSANNELLAVAKLSEPLKKTPSNELTLRVRLDF